MDTAGHTRVNVKKEDVDGSRVGIAAGISTINIPTAPRAMRGGSGVYDSGIRTRTRSQALPIALPVAKGQQQQQWHKKKHKQTKAKRRESWYDGISAIRQKDSFLARENAKAQAAGSRYERNMLFGGLHNHKFLPLKNSNVINASREESNRRRIIWFNVYDNRSYMKIGQMFHRSVLEANNRVLTSNTTRKAGVEEPRNFSGKPLPRARAHTRQEIISPDEADKLSQRNSSLRHLNSEAQRCGSLFERNTFQTAIDGYTFLPRGNAYLSRRVRELSNATSKLWFNVRVRPVATKVRSGLLIQDSILATAKRCEEETREYRASITAKRDAKDFEKAAKSIKSLLPKIPNDICSDIIKRGWEKYSKRVGRTSTLTLVQKVKLATLAYIRHNFTNYEGDLRQMVKYGGHGHKKKARSASWGKVVEKWVEWGGSRELLNDRQVPTKPPKQRFNQQGQGTASITKTGSREKRIKPTEQGKRKRDSDKSVEDRGQKPTDHNRGNSPPTITEQATKRRKVNSDSYPKKVAEVISLISDDEDAPTVQPKVSNTKTKIQGQRQTIEQKQKPIEALKDNTNMHNNNDEDDRGSIASFIGPDEDLNSGTSFQEAGSPGDDDDNDDDNDDDDDDDGDDGDDDDDDSVVDEQYADDDIDSDWDPEKDDWEGILVGESYEHENRPRRTRRQMRWVDDGNEDEDEEEELDEEDRAELERLESRVKIEEVEEEEKAVTKELQEVDNIVGVEDGKNDDLDLEMTEFSPQPPTLTTSLQYAPPPPPSSSSSSSSSSSGAQDSTSKHRVKANFAVPKVAEVHARIKREMQESSHMPGGWQDDYEWEMIE